MIWNLQNSKSCPRIPSPSVCCSYCRAQRIILTYSRCYICLQFQEANQRRLRIAQPRPERSSIPQSLRLCSEKAGGRLQVYMNPKASTRTGPACSAEDIVLSNAQTTNGSDANKTRHEQKSRPDSRRFGEESSGNYHGKPSATFPSPIAVARDPGRSFLSAVADVRPQLQSGTAFRCVCANPRWWIARSNDHERTVMHSYSIGPG